jgi:hypothetical protein
VDASAQSNSNGLMQLQPQAVLQVLQGVSAKQWIYCRLQRRTVDKRELGCRICARRRELPPQTETNDYSCNPDSSFIAATSNNSVVYRNNPATCQPPTQFWLEPATYCRSHANQPLSRADGVGMKALIAIVVGFSMYAIGIQTGRELQLQQPTSICQLKQ